MNANRSSTLLQQDLDVSIVQRPKRVYEANSRVELRVSCDALFDIWHANE